MTKLRWKPIPDFEEFYQANTLGEIRSLHRGKVRILKQGVYNEGYPVVVLSKNGEKKTCSVHKLVALTFLGNPKNGHEIAHKDGNKSNNSLSNLRYCTCSENNMDKHKHGTMPVGVQHYKSKLTQTLVDYIRLNKNKLLQKELCYFLGVDQSTISKIKHNHNWKSI